MKKGDVMKTHLDAEEHTRPRFWNLLAELTTSKFCGCLCFKEMHEDNSLKDNIRMTSNILLCLFNAPRFANLCFK